MLTTALVETRKIARVEPIGRVPIQRVRNPFPPDKTLRFFAPTAFLVILGHWQPVPVGTMVAHRPPARSVRAALPHTAPIGCLDGEPYASELGRIVQ